MDFVPSNHIKEITSPSLALEVFNSLEGNWKLTREILEVGSVEATAKFIRTNAATLHYHEQGTLTLASGFVGQISKEYIYVLDGEEIQIIFADTTSIGTRFITLRPTIYVDGLWSQDTHLCGQDSYQCIYRFVSKDSFVTTVKVDGVNKNYSTKTNYQRDLSA